MNTGFLQKEEKVTAWRNPLWDEWIDMTKAMISHGWKGPTENFPGFGRSSCFIGAHRFRKKILRVAQAHAYPSIMGITAPREMRYTIAFFTTPLATP